MDQIYKSRSAGINSATLIIGLLFIILGIIFFSTNLLISVLCIIFGIIVAYSAVTSGVITYSITDEGLGIKKQTESRVIKFGDITDAKRVLAVKQERSSLMLI